MVFPNDTDGAGIYRQDAILGPFPEPTCIYSDACVPQIEEIRVIIGEDGEEYINAKDMTVAMTQIAWSMATPTAGVLSFVRRFVIEFITARR
jgi:hypothetical protein